MRVTGLWASQRYGSHKNILVIYIYIYIFFLIEFYILSYISN